MSPTRPRLQPTRRYPRLTLRVEVKLTLADGRELKRVATTLGAGGLFVANDSQFARGTPLRVCFRLPGESTFLRLAARVAWCSETATSEGSCGLGLEFADPEARSQLAAILEDWAKRRETA